MLLEENIELKVILTEFKPNAMHDDFDSGEFAFYDASIIKIIHPSDLKGKTLTIYHGISPSPNNLWRKINQELKFSIKKELINEKELIFDGAINNLQVI